MYYTNRFLTLYAYYFEFLYREDVAKLSEANLIWLLLENKLGHPQSTRQRIPWPPRLTLMVLPMWFPLKANLPQANGCVWMFNHIWMGSKIFRCAWQHPFHPLWPLLASSKDSWVKSGWRGQMTLLLLLLPFVSVCECVCVYSQEESWERYDWGGGEAVFTPNNLPRLWFKMIQMHYTWRDTAGWLLVRDWERLGLPKWTPPKTYRLQISEKAEIFIWGKVWKRLNLYYYDL